MTAFRYYPGARALILVVIGVLCLAYGLTGCTPRPELHGRAAFDRWVAENTKTVHVQDSANTFIGWFDLAGDSTIYLNDTLLDALEPADQEWVKVHEAGHAVAVQLDLWIGTEPCENWSCPPAERAAQCVAEVVLGEPSTVVADAPAAGYWNCPAAEVDRTRLVLQAIGAW